MLVAASSSVLLARRSCQQSKASLQPCCSEPIMCHDQGLVEMFAGTQGAAEALAAARAAADSAQATADSAQEEARAAALKLSSHRDGAKAGGAAPPPLPEDVEGLTVQVGSLNLVVAAVVLDELQTPVGAGGLIRLGQSALCWCFGVLVMW